MNDKDFELESIISEIMEKKKKGVQQNFDETPEISPEPVCEHSRREPQSDWVEKPRNVTEKPVRKPSRNPELDRNSKKKKKMKKGTKIALIVLITVLSIIILLAIAFVAIAFHYINMIDIVPHQEEYSILDSIPPDDDISTNPESPPEVIQEAEDNIQQNVNNDTEKLFDDDVYNVLLIGTDSRNTNERGRSDSMILVSINKKTEEIHMTSFMRDAYVAIPGKQNNRINAAYAYGGPELLMDTIETNFKIKVDKYVRVNFFSFMEVIDAVGGVTITVSDAEVNVMNSYIAELNGLLGKDVNDGKLSKGGTYNLNGKQALGYCRVRYVGNADFQRTQRQRDVLMKVIEKTKDMSIAELNSFLEILLPKVTTNIPEDEIFSLVLNSLSYTKYPIYQHRVPDDGTWWNLRVRGMAVLGMNFDKNINMLKKEIYGK